MTEELSQECWHGAHLAWSLALGLPGLLLIVLGFPLITLASLIESRKHLDTRSTRLQLGFLFKGFRKGAFYWESLAILRKVAVAFLAVFVGVSKIQAYLLLALLLSFAYSSARVQPYISPRLNRLEVFSFCSLAISVFAACFFLSSQD